jgi:hypothetical protein
MMHRLAEVVVSLIVRHCTAWTGCAAIGLSCFPITWPWVCNVLCGERSLNHGYDIEQFDRASDEAHMTCGFVPRTAGVVEDFGGPVVAWEDVVAHVVDPAAELDAVFERLWRGLFR